MKRTDYAPIIAPPNPRADEARAAMRAYMQPMLHVNAAPVVESQAVEPCDELVIQNSDLDLLERVLEKHADKTDEAKIAPEPPAVRYEDAAYYLTWPAGQSRVCCVAGQWDYTASGEIEAWYSVEQLKAALASIEDAMRFEKKGERE